MGGRVWADLWARFASSQWPLFLALLAAVAACWLAPNLVLLWNEPFP